MERLNGLYKCNTSAIDSKIHIKTSDPSFSYGPGS
jgi:hypothetical protein